MEGGAADQKCSNTRNTNTTRNAPDAAREVARGLRGGGTEEGGAAYQKGLHRHNTNATRNAPDAAREVARGLRGGGTEEGGAAERDREEGGRGCSGGGAEGGEGMMVWPVRLAFAEGGRSCCLLLRGSRSACTDPSLSACRSRCTWGVTGLCCCADC